MAYTRQNFVDGQVLKAEDLNTMEDGIEAAVSTTAQSLSASQKAQARRNIGAASEDAVGYEFGHGLTVEGKKVSVNTADTFEGDNTLPASAALVQSTVGNIEILLGTI